MLSGPNSGCGIAPWFLKVIGRFSVFDLMEFHKFVLALGCAGGIDLVHCS